MTIRPRTGAFAAAVLATFALAACSSGDTVEAENESAESVAKRVAESDIKPLPGKWESTMSLQSIEIPGMPAEMQDMMKQRMGKMNTTTSCLTAEQVEKPNADFFGPGEGSGCTYNSFKMGGGKIDADMTCQQQGMTQNMQMTGTYSEEHYSMNMTADGEVQGQPMKMAMKVESSRVGECEE